MGDTRGGPVSREERAVERGGLADQRSSAKGVTTTKWVLSTVSTTARKEEFVVARRAQQRAEAPGH